MSHEAHKFLVTDSAVFIYICLIYYDVVVAFVENVEEVGVGAEDALQIVFADESGVFLVEELESFHERVVLQEHGRAQHGRLELAELNLVVTVRVDQVKEHVCCLFWEGA